MSLKIKFRAVWERMHSIVLLCIGFGFIGWEIYEKVWRGPEVRFDLFIANAVAFLAIVIGMERFVRFADVDERLSETLSQLASLRSALSASTVRLEHRISTVLPSRLVEGYDSVYSEATKLIPSATRSIKALLVGVSTPAPVSFAEAICEHLKHNPAVSYEVLLCVDFAGFDSEFWEKNKKRREYYLTAGVLDRLVLRALNTKRPVGFDVLVIDNKHACLAFSPVAGTSLRREASIIFEDQPEIAQHLSNWIDKAKPKSVDFLDAEQRWRRDHPDHKPI